MRDCQAQQRGRLYESNCVKLSGLFSAPINLWRNARKLPAAGTAVTIFFTLVVIASVWTISVLLIKTERDQAFSDEVTRNSNLALAHEERVKRVTQLLDQTLLTLRDDYYRMRQRFDVNARLAALGIDRKFVGIVSIIGANGEVIASTSEGLNLNFSDRDYFRDHAANPSDRLIIGRPIKGRVTNSWIVALTRPLHRPDGRFDGVVFMAVDPTYFAQDYRDIVLGKHAALAIIGTDGFTRVRRNSGKISFGEDIRSSRLFQELPKSPQGHYVGVAASDGVLRTASYRVVEGTSLVVLVGSSLDDVANSLKGRRIVYLVSATVITLLILVAAIMLFMLRLRRWENQQSMLEANALLEERVKQRTAEIEGFMYSVSHDLRAPLRMIDGNAGMLGQELAIFPDSDAARFLATIRGGVKRMSALLEDLLDLSKYSTRELSKETIDMHNKVKSIVEEHKLLGGNAQIEVGEMPAAQGDRILIRQVWTNLIGNAIKYSGTRTDPQIRIGHKDGAYFVEDNGVGFDASYQDKLFKLFSRLHDEREFEGTGIGLAVIKRIIERHGGKIWAEGKVGEGAKFSFTLPDV